MVSTIMSSIGSACANVVIWLTTFINSLNGIEVMFIAGFTIFTVTRILIKPLVGSAGSDQVKANKKDKNSNSDK